MVRKIFIRICKEGRENVFLTACAGAGSIMAVNLQTERGMDH